MQSLRSERVYGEADYVEAFSDGRQLPDTIIGQWCDSIWRAADHLGLVRPILADLGCGDGRFTLPLARRCRLRGRIVAIDKSRPMLERLRNKVAKSHLKNITVVLEDISSFIPAEKFQVCFASEVVHSFRWDPCLFQNIRHMSDDRSAIVIRCQTEAQARERRSYAFLRLIPAEDYSEGMRRAREYASGRPTVRCESKWTCLTA